MTLTVVAPDGVPEIAAGDDLVALLLPLVDLRDGDVVVVTSKVVSKAEGRVVDGAREEHLAAETARVVARRPPTTIVRTRHGLTLAAAGIDGSNVTRGRSVLLPLDPDDSARRLRAGLHERTGLRLGVVVTDTAGRAWREGQTDIAVGVAGLRVLEEFAGRLDAHGNELAVTAPAVADEIAGAAELAQGKLGARPFAVVGGRSDLVLPVDDDGPGAVALVRAEGGDLFGYGAREAVLRAVRGLASEQQPFGAPVPADQLVQAVREATDLVATAVAPGEVTCPARRVAEVSVVAFAFGWRVEPHHDQDTDLRIRPVTP